MYPSLLESRWRLRLPLCASVRQQLLYLSVDTLRVPLNRSKAAGSRRPAPVRTPSFGAGQLVLSAQFVSHCHDSNSNNVIIIAGPVVCVCCYLFSPINVRRSLCSACSVITYEQRVVVRSPNRIAGTNIQSKTLQCLSIYGAGGKMAYHHYGWWITAVHGGQKYFISRCVRRMDASSRQLTLRKAAALSAQFRNQDQLRGKGKNQLRGPATTN